MAVGRTTRLDEHARRGRDWRLVAPGPHGVQDRPEGRDGAQSAVHAKRAKSGMDMHFDGARRNAEPAGYDLVGASFQKQFDHVPLPLGQAIKCPFASDPIVALDFVGPSRV